MFFLRQKQFFAKKAGKKIIKFISEFFVMAVKC